MLVTLETTIGDVKGMMNLCIPYLTIEPIIPKLSTQYFFDTVHRPLQPARTSTTGLAADAEVYFEGERLSLGRPHPAEEGIARTHAGVRDRHRVPAGRRRAPVPARGREGRLRPQGRGRGPRRCPRPAASAPGSAEIAGALQEAMRSFTSGIGASLKTIEDRIAELARKQDEVTDQLIFESPDREVPSGDRRGPAKTFGGFAIGDCEPLAAFLAVEHPQTVALVLSHLQPGVAACVLANLPAELQPDVIARICAMDRVDPEVLSVVDRVLRVKIGAIAAKETKPTGGVATVVEILNVAPRAIEKHVIESLEQSDAAMAEEIKQRMFVFEDITLLDRDTVARVLKEVPEDDLVLALKATIEKVRGFVWECVPGADAAKAAGPTGEDGSGAPERRGRGPAADRRRHSPDGGGREDRRRPGRTKWSAEVRTTFDPIWYTGPWTFRSASRRSSSSAASSSCWRSPSVPSGATPGGCAGSRTSSGSPSTARAMNRRGSPNRPARSAC